MSRVYLIRHAKPAAVWGGGDDDPGLDAEGAAQAQAVAQVLLALPQAERPGRVVSSPLRRCRETAAPLAQALGVAPAIDARVGEIPTPASLAPADRPAWLRAAFAGRWRDITGDLDYEAWRRGVAAAVAGHAGAAVFSHYVAINAVLSLLANDDRVLVARPDHGSVTVLESDEAALTLIARGREATTGVL